MPRPIQSRLIVDAAAYSYLVTCLDCEPFREVRSTRAGALAAGAIHLKSCHGDTHAARKVRYLATRGGSDRGQDSA